MQGDPQPFDLGKLSCRIDQEREERGLTMTALAQQVGVAASTIRRFRTADDAEADGVLALIAWLGDPPEHFIIDSSVGGTPLPQAGTGQIRVDMGLVIAAQTSGRTVASLTRWSQF